jgi:hypothetical protein
MARRNLTIQLPLVVLSSVMLQAQPPRSMPAAVGTGVIRGRVVTYAAEPAPIVDARVSIAGPTTRDPIFSDELGRFEISDLAPGRYVLTAEKTGFAKTRYGAKGELDVPQPVDVAVAAAIDGVQIAMPKGAAISGQILDELGDPIVGGTVSAGVLQAAGPSSRIVTVRSSSTNDRGEFRIGGLAAGHYYVSIDGTSEGFNSPGSPPEWARSFTWAKTYYLASPGLTGASPIVLGVGEEHTGVDFAIVPAQPAKLTLSLGDASGAPATGLINLLLPGESPGSILSNRGVPLSPANPRMTNTLEPGEWVAVALVPQGRALAHIKVSSGDELAVTLRIGSGARLAGRVIFDGSAPQPAFTSIRLGVRGAGLDAGVPGLAGSAVTVKADGTFEMDSVVGTIALQPAAPIPGWTLRSETYGDRDFLDQPLTVGEGDDVRGIQIVFTDQLADFSGTVVTADGRPAPGCSIAVFPQRGELSFDSRRARLQRADQNGRFRMTDLLAGSYAAAATPDVDAAVWMTPAYLGRLQAAAVPVTVGEREQKTATLQCVSLQ